MSFLIKRSIPLGRATMAGWRDAGGVFTPRGTPWRTLMDLAQDHEFLLNLGSTGFSTTTDSVKLVNVGRNISDLVSPGETRRKLWAYMPPRPVEFPAKVWIKTPGRAGVGKYQEVVEDPLVLPTDWDWQQHVDGQEYRLITVGKRIVQNFARYGDNGDREYHWVRMFEMPEALKDMVRGAAAMLEGTNVIAWDTILTPEGVPYLFEGNSCPGMSAPTAGRIYREVMRQIEEGTL